MSGSMSLPSTTLLCRPLLAIEEDNHCDLSSQTHAHDFHQFLYVRQGRMVVNFGDRLFTVLPGHFAAIPPHQIHTLQCPAHADEPTQVVQLKCWLRPDAGFPEVADVTDCRGIASHMEGSLRLLLDAFADRTNVDQDRAIGGQIMYLLALVGSASRSHPQPCDRRIKDATDYITAHLHETISVCHLARRADLDQSYFSRLFRAQLGLSPQAYLCRQRLERARGLLVFTDASIATIAEAVGYPNYHHFSNQFLTAYRIRPSDYRASMQNPDTHRRV